MEKLRSSRAVDMSEPMLAEESTFTSLALPLRSVLEQLNENATHHDYLVALLLVLSAESGLRVLSPLSDKGALDGARSHDLKPISRHLCVDHRWNANKSNPAKSTDHSSESSILDAPERRSAGSVRIPPNWKSSQTGLYEVHFALNKLSHDVRSKLIVMPFGDKLVVNMLPYVKEKRTYSMVVQTLKYVNPYSNSLCGRYINLKEISHRFKDSLVTPTRVDMLLSLGLMSPSLQGLPVELKIYIINMLCKKDLMSLKLCSPDFYKLCLGDDIKLEGFL